MTDDLLMQVGGSDEMPTNGAAGVGKSRDNFDLSTERRRAGVRAYQVAAELGVHPTAVSQFETGKRAALPSGMGASEYREAIGKIVARREKEAAA